jgi:hypothetical protein
MEHDIGDKVTLKALFYNKKKALADPTAISLKIKDPGGNEAAQTPTRVGEGTYTYDLIFDEAGLWYFRWEATGAVHTAGEGRIKVRTSDFTLS